MEIAIQDATLTDAIISVLEDRHEIELTRVDLSEIGKQVAASTDFSEANNHLSVQCSSVPRARIWLGSLGREPISCTSGTCTSAMSFASVKLSKIS
ncbi:hypothetical protein [Hyphomicrobium sp. 2TAF46]|uniref:hypothetical protein n=1 Tax=Hyphomicrobium sp. 2TAF46 TaxID=3233019 RepID=UPI003F90C66C